ncbi:MAG: tRNA (guanosine(46)-N7)-methyltransferase TrmB [Ruminococcaceae bacterium]|nr:tRNA (guanosine(46)-N7)-methyltransferase TrmB [Oscillospiraceae bacterium]
MRMRKKKHREERLSECSAYFIDDFSLIKDDIKNVFDNNNPIYLEIGCGKGRFITETASLNPDINFIAAEKNLDVLVLAAEKVKNANLKNVKFIAIDATIFEEFNTKTKFDRIYINFCDPWKKKRQAKRRLTHERFLSIYKNILSENGEIHFKTDNVDLFEFSLNSFSDYGLRLKNITLNLHQSDFEGNVMTEYEELFSKKGQPIYRCEAKF